jgi:hypothetical protein
MRKINQCVRINFSEFLFDICKYKDNIYLTLVDEIKQVKSEYNEKEFILEYLNFHGYRETLFELDKNFEINKNVTIVSLIREYKFKEVISLIENNEQITFLEICDCLLKIAESFNLNRDNLNSIISLRQILQNENFSNFVKTNKILDNFINTFIQELGSFNNKPDLKLFLNPEVILEYINGNSRLDTIVKQAIVILKESYKLGEPTISYILNDKDFLNKLK